MQVLSVISRLLDYPDAALFEYKQDLCDLVEDSELNSDLKAKVVEFITQHLQGDVLDWQSEYDSLFERGRSLGLWLFEHVHGESRDRGQAMVDLVSKYREAGLEISQHELPDYIPMFLEFLATQGEENAKGWMQEVEDIFALLMCRLENRESDYSVLFEALLSLSDSTVALDDMRKQISSEKRDDTKQAIDKEWEEEEVTFGADSLEKSCDSKARRPSESQRRDLDVPLNWVDFDKSASMGNQAEKNKQSSVQQHNPAERV